MNLISEQQRIAALRGYQIVDTAQEAYFDQITQTAALAANMPIAFISFIDDSRQWFKSQWGFNFPELPRELTFCNTLLTQSLDVLVVNNAAEDHRFADHPAAKTKNPVICCISVPLKSSSGAILGSMCVIDHQPRKIEQPLVDCLKLLARLVEDKLEIKKDALLQVSDKERQSLVNAALDASIDHIYIIDPLNMKFLECNETAVRDMGYSKKELFTMGPQDICPQLTKEALRDRYEAVLKSPQQTGSLYTVHRTKSGALLDVKIQLKKFTSAYGKIILIATVKDITPEYRAQLALEESEKKYRSLFECMPNMVMRTDQEGKIVLLSNASFALLGYHPEELIGTYTTELYVQKNMRKIFIRQLANTGTIKNFPTQFRTKDGKVKTCSINAQYYYNAHKEKEGIEGVVTDISGMLESQERITKTKNFYEHILHAIDADISVLDTENRFCFINRHIMPSDRVRKEFIGKTNLEHCHAMNLPADIATARQQQLNRVSIDEPHIQSIEKLEVDAETKYIQRRLSLFMADDKNIYKVRYGIDITNLKRTEIRLEQNEFYLKSLINSIPDAIYTLNAEGRFTREQLNEGSPLSFINHGLAGRAVHDVLGNHIGDLHLKNIEKALQEKRTISFEFHLDIVDKGRLFLESRMTPVSANEIVSVVRDISMRKRHDEEIASYTQLLVEREENLTSIINAGPDAVIVVDMDTNIMLWNPKSEALFGWNAEEAVGRSITDLIIPNQHHEAFKQGMFQFSLRFPHLPVDIPPAFETVTKKGDTIYVEATISLFKHKGNKTFITFLRDISEKMKADRQLKDRTKQLVYAQQIAQLASYAIDLDKADIQLSDNIFDILEIDPGNTINHIKQFLHYIHPDDQDTFNDRLINMVEDAKINTIEYRVLTQGGKVKHVSDSYHYVERKQKRCFGTIQDITERKMFDRKLFDAIIDSEERERSRIAGELHDGACQYMVTAKMSIETAKKLYATEPALAEDLLQNGVLQIMEAVQLTRKLSHDLVPAPLKTLGLLKAFEQLVEGLNKQNSIFFSFYSKGAERHIENNISTNLFRIAQEFIRNSQTHSKAKEVVVELNFLESFIEFSISDNGIGFNMKKVRPEGIGILNIIKRVETIGGKYHYEGKEGHGVKLWIRLTGSGVPEDHLAL